MIVCLELSRSEVCFQVFSRKKASFLFGTKSHYLPYLVLSFQRRKPYNAMNLMDFDNIDILTKDDRREVVSGFKKNCNEPNS